MMNDPLITAQPLPYTNPSLRSNECITSDEDELHTYDCIIYTMNNEDLAIIHENKNAMSHIIIDPSYQCYVSF